MPLLEKVVSNSLFVASTLLIYIFTSWLLFFQFKIHLLVSNAFAYSVTLAINIYLYRYIYAKHQSPYSIATFPFAIASVFSLSISEYFVYFFNHYGHMKPMLAIMSSMGITIMYFFAFNTFFTSKRKDVS